MLSAIDDLNFSKSKPEKMLKIIKRGKEQQPRAGAELN